MNIISIFFASLVMASAIVIGSMNNGDVDASGQAPQATTTGRNPIPAPAPPVQAGPTRQRGQ